MMSPASIGRGLRRAASLLLVLALPCSTLAAQAAGKKVREFVRQGLLVPDFMLAPGIEIRAARRAGEAARDAVKKLVDSKDVEVIQEYRIYEGMAKAGYVSDGQWLEHDVRALGRSLRADEYLIARVERLDRQNGARVVGELVLMRDPRMRQPLPVATGPNVEAAGETLGRSLAAARAQLPFQRRCENALADGQRAAALQAGRAGVAAYPRSTLARTCLMWALKANGASHAEVLTTSREILEMDPRAAHALEAAATALDSLRRPAESAPLWVRLAHLDSTNFELAERVLYAMEASGSTVAAESLAVQLAKANPAHLPFTRHQWHTAFENKHWRTALDAGERLLAADTLAQADSVFYRRLALAYRGASQPIKAIEILARGISRFSGDSRLYSLYTQYVKEEADTVIGRGLTLFPKHGELLALQARDLRARGKLAEAVDAMKLAVAVDSMIPDGPLMLAQAEFELGRPDSALVSLRRALASSGDTTRVAQFAFARGNALYRAAHGTKSSADFSLGLRYLALADSLRPSAQTRLMTGLAALGVAQTAFTEAAQEKDKTIGCTLAQQATALLPIARSAIEAGREVSVEAVEQSLGYVAQLEPYAPTAIRGLCGSAATTQPR
jgi:tetratricopeptide (TPR) repeat protein